MYIGRERGGRDMTPLPTYYMNCGPCPLTVVQEAVLASWQLRFDGDGRWMEAQLGLLTASLGQHVPVGRVPSDPLPSPAAFLSFCFHG